MTVEPYHGGHGEHGVEDSGKMIEDELTDQILGYAVEVIRTLGCGFLEKVYENALSIELQHTGLNARQQAPIPVRYRGQDVGEYYADILVDDRVILELKTAKMLDRSHQAQLLHYLKATGFRTGLLLNFGRPTLGIKRMVL